MSCHRFQSGLGRHPLRSLFNRFAPHYWARVEHNFGLIACHLSLWSVEIAEFAQQGTPLLDQTELSIYIPQRFTGCHCQPVAVVAVYKGIKRHIEGKITRIITHPVGAQLAAVHIAGTP